MDNRDIRPSRWHYGLAVLVFIIGSVIFTLFLFNSLGDLSNRLVQLVVPGEYDITLSTVGRYTVFYEHQSVVGNNIYSTSQSIPGLRCKLLSNETGGSVKLSRSPMNATYSFGARKGVSVLSFSIDTPGSYEFSAWYPQSQEEPEIVLAIGYGFTKGLLGAIFGGLAIFFGTVAIGTVMALITFLKRRKARERLETDMSGRSLLEPR